MSMCGMPLCRHCGKPVQTTWGSAEWHAKNDPIGGYCQCVSNEFRQLAEAAKAKLESDKYQHMREACEEYLRPKGNMQSREDFVVKSFERRGKYDRVCNPDAVLSALNELAALKKQNALLTVQVTRYERLRILGCAPYGTSLLEKGNVMRFQSLDDFLDHDILNHPSRGESSALTAHPQQVKSEDARECRWTPMDEENMPGTYEGSCGVAWSFIEGGIKENDTLYCPRCGGKIVDVEAISAQDEKEWGL